MELLTSILAAVEAQNTRIATLTEQQKKLAGFVKVMDEETTRRAERIIAATAKLEVRQLWSAAAMCLVLLPVAVVVAGLWMGIAGLITGVQWALDVDGSVWLGIGRWLVVGAGLAGAGYRLFVSVRWVAVSWRPGRPRDAEVAPLAQEVIMPREGKRAARAAAATTGH